MATRYRYRCFAPRAPPPHDTAHQGPLTPLALPHARSRQRWLSLRGSNTLRWFCATNHLTWRFMQAYHHLEQTRIRRRSSGCTSSGYAGAMEQLAHAAPLRRKQRGPERNELQIMPTSIAFDGLCGRRRCMHGDAFPHTSVGMWMHACMGCANSTLNLVTWRR